MSRFSYTWRTVTRGRSSNIIKVISLTLGLFVAILLFVRIAYELDYDSGYQGADRVRMITANYESLIKSGIEYSQMTIGPVPRTIADAFPDQIEYGTSTRMMGIHKFYLGDHVFDYEVWVGDTLFFPTIGIQVLEGQIKDLVAPDAVFLSEQVARRLFGDKDPIGETINYINKIEAVTVKGVFRQPPANNTVRPDVVLSMNSIPENFRGWDGIDTFFGLIRLRSGVTDADVDAINARIPSLLAGLGHERVKAAYRLEHGKTFHLRHTQLRTRLSIMWALAAALLLIAALNYVLISIASLTQRAKTIGVHKCNGAGTRDIFAMFLSETMILTGVSLLGVVVLTLGFHRPLSDLLEVPIGEMFTWQVLWLPIVLVLLLLLIAGVLPGRAFARIPVSVAFKGYTESRLRWKRPLLFVQFAGVSFIFGLLCVVMLQYHRAVTLPVGFQPEGLASVVSAFDPSDAGKAVIADMPMVEELAVSMSDMGGSSLNGHLIRDNKGKLLFSTRLNACDVNYPRLVGLQLKAGRYPDADHQAMVNEEFARKWNNGNPIGQHLPHFEDQKPVEIVGVVNDFIEKDLFAEPQPVLFMTGVKGWESYETVRLRPPYRENLRRLNDAVKALNLPKESIYKYMPDRLKSYYDAVRRFRDIVLVSFFAVLLITLIGLVGYLHDEVQRRSKEIAIRKVNGAYARDILSLLGRQMMLIALPSVLIGIVASYYVSLAWLQQFERFRFQPDLLLYILIALGVTALIAITIVIKAWRIANEDPVKSIRCE